MWQKYDRKAIFIFLLGTVVSTVVIFVTNEAPPNFPLTVFAVSCTFLVAAIAFPQFAIGLSNSNIAKNLLPEFYKNYRHWLFLFFQAFIALSSIVVEHMKPENGGSCFLSRILLFLIVFDFFYGFHYLRHIKHLIASPERMLKGYVAKTCKIIKKELEKGTDCFKQYIRNFDRIGSNTATSYEKELALSIFDELLPAVMKADILEAEDDGRRNELQFDAWEMIIECVSNTCINGKGSASTSEKNIVGAIGILEGAWLLATRQKKRAFRYNVCTDTIKKMALLSVKEGYDNGVEEARRILVEIAENAILAHQSEHFVSPSEIATNLREIGISAISLQNYSIVEPIILNLIFFYMQGEERLIEEGAQEDKKQEDCLIQKNKLFLFEALNVMSCVWDSNNDALENLCNTLNGIGEEEITETINFSSKYFQLETARITRFIEAANSFRGQKYSTIFQVLKEVFKKLSGQK